MGLIDFDTIPGYAEACAEERAVRDLALLADPVPLCGVIVNQFTPRHSIRLGFCHNGFLVGGRDLTPEDVAMFLWFVAVDYSFEEAKRDAFVGRLAELKFIGAIESINGYLENAFMDAPGGGGGGKSYTAPAATLVDLMGHEYGWSMQTTLNTPWAVLFQLVKHIKRRSNPKALQFNPRSDGKLSEWLQAQNRGGN